MVAEALATTTTTTTTTTPTKTTTEEPSPVEEIELGFDFFPDTSEFGRIQFQPSQQVCPIINVL